MPGGGSALAELSPSLPPQVQSVQMAPYVHDEHDHEDEGEPGENATLTSLLLVVQPATGWVGSWSVSSDVDDELPVGPVSVVAEETDVEAGLLADAVFAELGWLWDGERVG